LCSLFEAFTHEVKSSSTVSICTINTYAIGEFP